MASVQTKVDGFQFEITRRGEVDQVNLVVSSVRGIRGKRNILGEAFLRDCLTPVTNFRVRHAADIEDLKDRFVRQLIKQGYLPLKFRKQVEGEFEDWKKVDLTGFDLSVLDAGTAAAVTSEG
jgi:hypothetical protein